MLFVWTTEDEQGLLPESQRLSHDSKFDLEMQRDATLSGFHDIRNTDQNKDQLLQAANVYFSYLASQMGLKQLGGSPGQYFHMIEIGEVKEELQIYKGFKISFDLFEGNITKLLVDLQTRVISKWTLLEQHQYDQEYEDDFNQRSFEDRYINNTFLHVPTNQKVIIDGFEMGLSPSTEFNYSGFKTHADYYQRGLGVEKVDLKQFLVYALKSRREKLPDGSVEIKEEKNFFLPQYLRRTGMTDEQKNDRNYMRDVAVYTKIDPKNRFLQQEQFLLDLKKILIQSEVGNFLQIEPPRRVLGLLMPKPTLDFGSNQSIFPQKGNFFIPRILDDKTAHIKNWTLIWESNEEFARKFEDNLILEARKIGIEFSKANFREFRSNRNSPLEKQLSQTLNDIEKTNKPQIIVMLLKQDINNKSKYSYLKNWCAANGE